MARHGENIRKRKDGRWEGRYKVFDENRGKYIYRSVYGSNYGETKEKLSTARLGLSYCSIEKKSAAAKDEWDCRKNVGNNGSVILFSQAASEWLTELSHRRKISTYIKYETVYRIHLASIVGPCKLSIGMAQEIRKKISDHLSEKELSESLQKSIICVANQILAFANKHYLVGIPLLEHPPVKAKKRLLEYFPGQNRQRFLNVSMGRQINLWQLFCCVFMPDCGWGNCVRSGGRT